MFKIDDTVSFRLRGRVNQNGSATLSPSLDVCDVICHAELETGGGLSLPQLTGSFGSARFLPRLSIC